MFTAKVFITLKEGVLDPQGKAVKNSLHALAYDTVKDVRVGKYLVIRFEAGNKSEAVKMVDDMCRKLLANPVIEQYSFELEGE